MNRGAIKRRLEKSTLPVNEQTREVNVEGLYNVEVVIGQPVGVTGGAMKNRRPTIRRKLKNADSMMRSGAGGLVTPPPLRLTSMYGPQQPSDVAAVAAAAAAAVVPEFLRPLPPRGYPHPSVRPPTLSFRKEDDEPFTPSYRAYPYPYPYPYIYPMIRPLEPYPYNSPPQSPLVRKPPVRLPAAKEPTTPTVKKSPSLKRSRAGPVRGFTRGSLIRVATGELKRVEDMRTEDFISSAESSRIHRLDPSTVVRIDNISNDPTSAILTLSYGQDRSQVEVECSTEHPFFVYGQGWASCSPERTLAAYGLKVHQLQVGDVCISLSPRPGAPLSATTVATTTTNHHSSSVRTTPQSSSSASHSVTLTTTSHPHHQHQHHHHHNPHQQQQHHQQHYHSPSSAPSLAAAATALSLSADRKRRWSAPDEIHEQQANKEA